MPLAIDIGNSTVGIKLFSQSDCEKDLIQIPTHEFMTEKILEHFPGNKTWIISCVVKKIDGMLQDFISTHKDFEIILLQKAESKLVDFSLYQSKIGMDRFSSVLGAASEFSPPFCIVDMGTATTFSVVDAHFQYQGGFIIPGITTLFKSLPAFTSLLPELTLTENPSSFLGTDTQTSIKNGIYYLALHGIQGIIEKIKKDFPQIKIIGSGGWSLFFKNFYDLVDFNLIFKGLKYYFYNEKK
ncbi:MAG TPA: hypothetical protein DHW82_01160 [Spirochaetia bacterium]|nr:MAG: hypothetical protein A2Y41_02660 [Spirochaetes bacterium GWB1_36_13]HCL55605.1 hypothetical protein [Spirochaetia bacterium]